MSEEKKNEVNEEVKEARELTGKEPARVSGGADGDIVFFEFEKGFGFIEPENGGKDVFVDQETISCK